MMYYMKRNVNDFYLKNIVFLIYIYIYIYICVCVCVSARAA